MFGPREVLLQGRQRSWIGLRASLVHATEADVVWFPLQNARRSQLAAARKTKTLEPLVSSSEKEMKRRKQTKIAKGEKDCASSSGRTGRAKGSSGMAPKEE